MSKIGSIFGGGGSSTTSTGRDPTPEETALVEKQTELLDFQLAQLQKQAEFQTTAFDQASGLLDLQQAEVQRIADRRAELEPVQQEMLDRLLAQVRSGGQATPEQIALIDQATEAALEAGESDIGRAERSALETLREELAPARGLRPTDTPILDRGARVAEEATRQRGQLARDLRGAAATARLNFPLAAGSQLFGQASALQNFAQAQEQFSQQLRESAALNRLNLTQSKGGLGLGLATGVGANPGQTLSALANIRGTTSTTERGASFGDFANFLGGVGAVLQGFPSDLRIKKDIVPIGTLPNGLPIYEYRWAWEDDDAEKKWGVLAQEVERIMPEAVIEKDGVKRVNYAMLLPHHSEAA